MRKHTITVYANDEYSLYDILNEVRSEIDRKDFDMDYKTIEARLSQEFPKFVEGA